MLCIPASAQDTYLDSINVLLASNPGEERTAELLWDAAYYTLDIDETYTRQYTEPLLELPTIKADSTLLIEALRVQSDADRWTGKYTKGIENFKTCYDYYTRMQDTTNIIFCANHLGSMKVFMGYNQEAQKYIFEVYDLTKAQGDPAEIGHATNGLAIFYTNIGQDDKGIERYIEALEIFEEVQDTIGQGRLDTLLNYPRGLGFHFDFMGYLRSEQGRHEEAYEMYTTALTIRKELPSNYNISESRVCVASSLFELGRYDEAIQQAQIILDEERIQLHLDIEDVEIDVDTLVPLGLIINELVTNSLKYAFPGERLGKLNINLREEAERLKLTVTDDGVGYDKTTTKQSSFGNKLIASLTKQLKGEMTALATSGTEVSIAFKQYKLSRR